MIGRQTDVEINSVTFKKLTTRLSDVNQPGLWKTELSTHGFLSPLPAPLPPPGLSIIKCYQSGYKISVE